MTGVFPTKFTYTQRPSYTISIPWEQQAFAKVAALTMALAEQQGVVLARRWCPPTEIHHCIHRTSPLLGRTMPNYFDLCVDNGAVR